MSGDPINLNNRERAAQVARDIFQLGNRGSDKAQRMQYKGGIYPDNETDLGGLCEESLAAFVKRSLDDFEIAEKRG